MRKRASLYLLMAVAALGSFGFGAPATAGEKPPPPPPQALDLAVMLPGRQPAAILSLLKDAMRSRVEESLSAQVKSDAEIARARNLSNLYPNPSLQAYVNNLGQALLPAEMDENLLLSFKILQDPMPYADSLTTGTVYLSSGLVSLLDNESQLAFVLMHEAAHQLLGHHLLRVIDEEKAERKEELIKLGTSLAGVVLTRGLLSSSGMESPLFDATGAYYGYKGGKIGAAAYGRYRQRRFVQVAQEEADQFAAQVLLDRGFDSREGPVLLAKVNDIVQRSNAAVGLAFANGDQLMPRAQRLVELLRGLYRPSIEQVLTRRGFRMSSPRYSQLMAELKRDNGLLALESDLFTIAKANLEDANALLTADPMILFGLGRLYRAVGRTPEHKAKATGYFRSAIDFDAVRHRFPEAYLEYAVELLNREDPRFFPEIQKALKSYVVLFQRQRGGQLPPEMPFIYDNLERAGDPGWIAYEVTNIASEAPYQLTGDPGLDRSATPEAQAPAPVPAPPTPAKPKSAKPTSAPVVKPPQGSGAPL